MKQRTMSRMYIIASAACYSTTDGLMANDGLYRAALRIHGAAVHGPRTTPARCPPDVRQVPAKCPPETSRRLLASSARWPPHPPAKRFRAASTSCVALPCLALPSSLSLLLVLVSDSWLCCLYAARARIRPKLPRWLHSHSHPRQGIPGIHKVDETHETQGISASFDSTSTGLCWIMEGQLGVGWLAPLQNACLRRPEFGNGMTHSRVL